MNPYFEVVDSMQAKEHRFRAGRMMTALPGRRTIENRGKPLPRQKLEALQWGLGHSSPVVRRMCLELLDQHPDPTSVPKILACLSDPVPRVRWHAVHALSCDACKEGQTLCTPEVMTRLEQVAQMDANERVRDYAVRVVSDLAL